MILCPKCGKVKKYGIDEYVYRVRTYNENDECVDTAEDVKFQYSQPRCLNCNSIVRMYVDPDESEGKE